MKIIDVSDTIPSTNYSTENMDIKGIIYHITADTKKGIALNWFKNPNARVSSHYIVEPDGSIHLCVIPPNKAFHAGIVKSPTAQIILDNITKNPNQFMIGIEVVADGGDISVEQFKALKSLTLELCSMYNIPLDRYNIIGHNESNSIDKYFDPISSYSVNEIIRGIEADIKVENLQRKIAMMEIFQNDAEYYKEKSQAQTERNMSLWQKIINLRKQLGGR